MEEKASLTPWLADAKCLSLPLSAPVMDCVHAACGQRQRCETRRGRTTVAAAAAAAAAGVLHGVEVGLLLPLLRLQLRGYINSLPPTLRLRALWGRHPRGSQGCTAHGTSSATAHACACAVA